MTELVGHEVASTQPFTNGPIKWTDGTEHYFYFNHAPTIWGSPPKSSGANGYIKDNITLEEDDRYLKIIKVKAQVGDSNPWLMKSFLAAQKAAAQLTVGRTIQLGMVDYYAFAFKVDAWTNPAACQWADIISVGYQTAANDQLALALKYDNTHGFHYSIQSNAGYGNDPTKNPVGTTFYRDFVKPVVFGQWEEFVVPVKWATDKTGFVQIYNRVPSGPNTWSKLYEKEGIDTQFYGTSPYGSFPQSGDRGVIDKVGLYYGVYPAGTSQTVHESGLSRCSDLATAQAQFPV